MKAGDEGLLVAAAVAGKSLSQIARECGLSVRTVQRRLGDPAVMALIAEARTRQREEALGRLGGMRERALTRLQELVDCEDEKTALRAVGMVLATSAKFDLVHDLEVRIAAMESGIEKGGETDAGNADDEYGFEEAADTGEGDGGGVG